MHYFINFSLPRWANAIQIIHFGWQIAHVLVDLLDGTEPAQRLKALMDKFDDIGKQVKSVYDVSITKVAVN